MADLLQSLDSSPSQDGQEARSTTSVAASTSGQIPLIPAFPNTNCGNISKDTRFICGNIVNIALISPNIWSTDLKYSLLNVVK